MVGIREPPIGGDSTLLALFVETKVIKDRDRRPIDGGVVPIPISTSIACVGVESDAHCGPVLIPVSDSGIRKPLELPISHLLGSFLHVMALPGFDLLLEYILVFLPVVS